MKKFAFVLLVASLSAASVNSASAYNDANHHDWKCNAVHCATVASDTDSTFLCPNEGSQPITVTVGEALSQDIGTRSVSQHWFAPTARVGHVDGGTNVGIYTLSCMLSKSTAAWTDVSGSTMDAPNTVYAFPVASN